jgi:hypothetical protein
MGVLSSSRLGIRTPVWPWGFVLQALALVHFLRRRPEGYWFFVIMFLGWPGAVVYLVIEVAPDFDLLRAMFQKRARQRRIGELNHIVQENSAIGNDRRARRSVFRRRTVRAGARTV